jgi:hypothetical protein
MRKDAIMRSSEINPRLRPRINHGDLVTVCVAGQIAHPVGRANPYRIGYDGVPRVLPATGGIVLSHRIGDRCVGLAGDHIEPGVALHNNGREVVGPRNGPNNALITYACVGNAARVISGPATGRSGIVTGKHGGVNHVIADFPTETLRRLQIGDRIQIVSQGLGMRLSDYPDVIAMNISPQLIWRWGIRERDRRLHIPVTHVVPSAIMGSGLGKNTAWRGDYDIQLADADVRRRFRLGSLRFGDMVAVTDADNRRGPLFRRGRITLGIIVHGDSTVSGHGPGVTPLLTGPVAILHPVFDADANLARILRIRALATPAMRIPLPEQERRSLPAHSATPHLAHRVLLG